MPVPDYDSSVSRLKKQVRLGINVLDLMRMSDFVRVKVIKTGELRLNVPIQYGDAGDERFVELICDTLTASLVLDFVRNEGRVERSTVCRVYIKRGDAAWSKLGFNDVLTEKEGDHYVLSPKIFPVEIEPEPYVGGSAERVLTRKRK